VTAIPKLSALFETSLASALSAAGTSFTVVSGTDRDGNALSGLYGFIIDEGSADEEFVVGTISSTTVTISKRGCDADAPETEVSANKKAHRRGASVKITDYPIMAYLRNGLNGETGYELPNFLKMASTVGLPTDDKHLATKEYVDDAAAAGTGIPNKIIVAGTAGATVAAGNLIYFDDTDNEWKLCDADTAATVENTFLGIAQGAGVDGGAISNGVLLFGVDANQSGLTIGAKYYASNTAGGLSSSAGTKEVTIGWGKSATELYFCPRFDQHITEDIQDALTPGGAYGTPSSSNPYLTKDYNASSTGVPVVRVYTSNDTWTKPAALKYVVVEVQAAGGGGGGTTTAGESSGGGGGGGYSKKLIAAASLGATETVTIGAAGTAGAGTGATGGTGGNSSFGSHATANGGAGGTQAGLGGAGGTAASGDINIPGQTGGSGEADVATDEETPSGQGGDSQLGKGGASRWNASQFVVGEAGKGYGGGGSGAFNNNGDGSDAAGGAGAAGVVIVTEYFS